MPKSKNQKLKLYYIIEYFKRYTDENHPVSVSELIEYLQSVGITAERKSIYRDISAMEALGYEVISLHDKHFTYYLADREFETAELRMLSDAVASSRFITKKKSAQLIKKLSGLTTEYDADKLQAQIFVANRIKASNESIYYNVDAIHNAISENSKISFVYYDWDKSKKKVYRHNGERYLVSPWALVWNNENYYMVGFDSREGKIRHYRVDRMLSIATENEVREGKAEFKETDTAQYTKKFFGMYDGERVEVTLNCDEEITNAVVDMFGTDVEFIPQNDGKTFNVTVDLAVSPVFLSWVFMFGGKVRIVSPKSIHSRLEEMARKILGE